MQRRYFRADFAHAAILTMGMFAAQPLMAQDADAPAETIEFSSQATALPFPPDARELEFDATFDGIEYKSGSSLDSLADFYRREMSKRGWTEDAEAFERDDETITLVFEHDARVEIELDQYSDDVVSVEFDCEGVEFDGVDDPATLIAAGIPQPRAYVFLQKEIPRPEEYQDLFYRSGSCHFKAPLELQAAFDFYNKSLKGAGWKEIRKPIVDSDRRYTEFRKNGITVSVNIFSDDVGARIILGYENPSKEKLIPPLPRVTAATPVTADGEPAPEGESESSATTAKSNVDVSKNKGTATITLGAEKYVFKFAAAFRNKEDGEEKTKLLFTDRAIPMQKMQAMLAKKEDFSYFDLFEFNSPGQLTIEFGEYTNISFNSGGTSIGNSIEAKDCDLKFENGRVTGTVNLAEPIEFFDEKFDLDATIDAAIMTPNTQLGGAAVEEEITARESPFQDSESDLLLPSDASNVNGGGSRYSKTMHADSDFGLLPLVKFYRKELAAQGYKESSAKNVAANASNATLTFTKDGAKLTVAMTRSGEQTTLDVSSSDDARAKADGVLPEAGKGRIVLANASTENIVIAIGKKDYPLKAGQGEADPKEALNYSVVPGKYKITVKFPGKSPQTETIEITAGATWGLFALPAGDYITNQLYGGSSENE